MALLRELEHSTRAVDVDSARSVETQIKRHRRCSMHDLGDPLRQAVAVDREPEMWAGNVTANRDHPLQVSVTWAEERAECRLDAKRDLTVISASYECIHATLSAL